MESNAKPQKAKLWTRWFSIGVIVIAIGAVFALIRMIFGLGAVTNMSDGVPWGIWIAFDVVTGIALAAGGFTMAALVYIFNKGKYSPLMRPALVTAMLGYAIAAFSIVIDVGRWWQIYNPVLPWYWQGNSPLFEVSICVMTYLTILIMEFVPVASERYKNEEPGWFGKLVTKLAPYLNKIMIFLIILGVVISTLHQSSLGSTMLIAMDRIHPLWHSPWLPAFFLISAVAIGFGVVVIESYISAKTFKRPWEKGLLGKLTRFTPWVLLIYIALKVFDLVYYGKYELIYQDYWWGLVYVLEMLIFAVIPMFIFFSKKLRENREWLLTGSIMMVIGLVANRLNTYLITYEPRPGFDYFPSIGEFFVTGMFVALLFVGYKLIANYFPVLEKE